MLHPASEFDMEKVQSTIKQFVRDWSDEGQEEREACYTPIIDEILDRFPHNEWLVYLLSNTSLLDLHNGIPLT